MARKTCPNCKEQVGVRTILCKCGYHYPSEKVRKDLLAAKTAPKGPSAGQGKKFCKGCKEVIGARCHLCPKCGYYYPEDKVRQDLLEEKQNPSTEEIKTYKEAGRGRKTCPDCGLIVGGRTQTCTCGFDFVAWNEERAAEKEEQKEEKKEKSLPKKDKMTPECAEMLAYLDQNPYEAPPTETPRDHAERILSYGKKRAELMLLQHNIHHYWSHVDWKYVEEQLEKHEIL